MLDDVKLTKAERAAIERAYSALYTFTRSDWELDNWTAQERKGYANDRVPLIAAKALIVKWFMYGVCHPDELLRDTYNLRPSAVYMQGLGARTAYELPFDFTEAQFLATTQTLALAVDAWKAAFERSHQRNLAAIRAATANL